MSEYFGNGKQPAFDDEDTRKSKPLMRFIHSTVVSCGLVTIFIFFFIFQFLGLFLVNMATEFFTLQAKEEETRITAGHLLPLYVVCAVFGAFFLCIATLFPIVKGVVEFIRKRSIAANTLAMLLISGVFLVYTVVSLIVTAAAGADIYSREYN